MKTFKVVVAFVLAVMLAAPAFASEPVTVGWLLQQIAVARNLPATSSQEAEAQLRASGIALAKLDPSKPLTEGDIVSIGRSMGVNVTTQTPSAPSSKQQAQAFVVAFAPSPESSESARTQDIGGEPNENSDNGKGKKKGHNKSSSEPL